MLYPFISYPNGTEIVHSEIYYENNNINPIVRVEIEEPEKVIKKDIIKAWYNKFKQIQYIDIIRSNQNSKNNNSR